jgi:hypothetical protein
VALPIKTTRFVVVVLAVSLVALICAGLAAKSLGISALSPRLLAITVIADSVVFCFLLWRIRRARLLINDVNAVAVKARNRSTLGNISQTVGLYATLEGVVCAIVCLAFGVATKKVFVAYLLFLIPVVATMPLVFWAREMRDRPKSAARRMALAMFVFFASIGIAMLYSGALNWLDPGGAGPTNGEVFFIVLFLGSIGSVMAYRSTYKQLISNKS